MGQRPKSALPNRSTAGTWETFVQCEVEHDAHEVHPTSWPPRRLSAMDMNPTMALTCVRCGCQCLAEAGHATGDIAGIKVVLPEIPKAEKAKQNA